MRQVSIKRGGQWTFFTTGRKGNCMSKNNTFNQQEDRDLTVIKLNVCSCRTFLLPVG